MYFCTLNDVRANPDIMMLGSLPTSPNYFYPCQCLVGASGITMTVISSRLNSKWVQNLETLGDVVPWDDVFVHHLTPWHDVLPWDLGLAQGSLTSCQIIQWLKPIGPLTHNLPQVNELDHKEQLITEFWGHLLCFTRQKQPAKAQILTFFIESIVQIAACRVTLFSSPKRYFYEC